MLQWPHNIGPLMTYMASCGNTPCTDFDPSGAKWFKIDELGLKPDGSGDWFQNDIMTAGDSFESGVNVEVTEALVSVCAVGASESEEEAGTGRRLA